jgi:hypothetical protein
MPSRKVPQKDVPVVLEELRGAGAREIRRSGVDVRGLVTVRWRDAVAEEERYAAELAAWKPLIALSLVFAAVVILVMLLFGM